MSIITEMANTIKHLERMSIIIQMANTTNSLERMSIYTVLTILINNWQTVYSILVQS